ncbi:MAG: hypothetical protein QM800_12185 [Paludibacter sp.]
MRTETKEFECCPPLDPAPWDDKMQTWENKPFIKAKVATCFYMPLNFGATMKRLNAKVDNAGAKVLDWLCLSDHSSKWNMDLYLAVDKEIPGAINTKLSGTFYSRVYEGDFNQTGKWCADFEVKAKEQNLKIEKWYMWYTTCPKCAKKYGKNYTVIIGKIQTL